MLSVYLAVSGSIPCLMMAIQSRDDLLSESEEGLVRSLDACVGHLMKCCLHCPTLSLLG